MPFTQLAQLAIFNLGTLPKRLKVINVIYIIIEIFVT